MAVKTVMRLCDNCGELVEYTISDPDITIYDGWVLFPLSFICESCVKKFDPRKKTGYELWKSEKGKNNESNDETSKQ